MPAPSVWLVTLVLFAEIVAISAALVAAALGRFPWLPQNLEVVAGCLLFGALGGCTYCLRGVYLNACVRKTWDIGWLPWYLIRPVISLILGGISYLFVKSGLLLFGATEQPDASQLGMWAVAFLAGLNVDKFVAKIEAVGQTVWGIEPSRQSKPEAASESNKTGRQSHE